MLEINKIYHGDCLDVMKDIDDESINLIIADIPYNIGKDKDWDKWKKQEDYIQYIGERFLQCQRVLKDNGSFYWFHNDFLQIVELQNWISKNTEFVFKQLIVWNKRFKGSWNQLNAIVENTGLRNYSKQVEYILFYTFQDETGLSQVYDNRNCFKVIKEYLRYERNKTRKAGFSDQDLRKLCGVSLKGGGLLGHYWGNVQWSLPTKEHYQKLQTTGYFQKPYEDLRREYEDLRLEYEDLRYTFNNQKTHHSVWNYEIASKDNHITPKPVPLIENIILHSSNEGDLILDLFAGSGTTAIACLYANRKYIMIEKEKKYIDIINKRIQEEKKKYRFIL